MSQSNSTKTQRMVSLQCAVLTISDTRTFETDTSGSYLIEAIQNAGHQLKARDLVVDDIYQLRAVVSKWIADSDVQVILTTGGTGFTGRDSTPEALMPLFDKQIIGFGELFRQLSYEDIGTSTVQSRAFAGISNKTIVFSIPGSTSACRMAWEKIIQEQLDSRHRPCNFVGQLQR